MSNLKEIRTRIQSVGATRKITSAMKMVSAAKFHKAQEAIIRYAPYAKKAHQILESIAQGNLTEKTSIWFDHSDPPKNVAIVVITSNSGMCGAFNLNIGKKVLEEVPRILPSLWGSPGVKFYSLGKKGNDFLEKQKLNVVANRNDLIEKPNFQAAAKFSSDLINNFLNGKIDEIYVVFNQFKNPAVQVPLVERVLPLSRSFDNIKTILPDYIYEPNQDQIAELIIPKIIRIWLYSYILESSAGEHGARTTSMHQATDNATELINLLTLQYNKARQAAITKEILEIVSGAEALRG